MKAVPGSPALSVIIPLYEEEGSIPELATKLVAALAPYTYEVIAVDDGSKDGTWDALKKVAQEHARFKLIRFGMNAGQTAALAAGIAQAEGAVIVTMDGDLENDPADIPALLRKLDEGYDVVSGWRQGRWANSFFTRRVPSNAANALIGAVTGLKLHDFGCTLKAYRQDVIKDIGLYGDMHRFIPAYVAARGGKVAELPVSFTPRKHGKSKYGVGRIAKVLMDLMVVAFLTKFLARPMRFFGGIGLFACVLGIIAGSAALLLRILDIKHLVETPLPLFAAFLFIVGIQFILFGVLAELLSRTYYEGSGRKPYYVRETVNGE